MRLTDTFISGCRTYTSTIERRRISLFLSNPLGEATCSARLTVVEDKLHGKMLPKFLKKFDHVTVKEGEEARFTSVIIGEPRPDVIWLFDHKPISVSKLLVIWLRRNLIKCTEFCLITK